MCKRLGPVQVRRSKYSLLLLLGDHGRSLQENISKWILSRERNVRSSKMGQVSPLDVAIKCDGQAQQMDYLTICE